MSMDRHEKVTRAIKMNNFKVCRVGNEVYLFYKGKLIYKKWLKLGYSKLF